MKALVFVIVGLSGCASTEYDPCTGLPESAKRTLGGCPSTLTSTDPISKPEQVALMPGPIDLGFVKFRRDEPDFVSWTCRDYLGIGGVAVEVGYLKEKRIVGPVVPKLMEIGFVLYNGTNQGTHAYYRRAGLVHRWDWGVRPGLVNRYSFVIETDGTGLYYDFSAVEGHTKDRADKLYTCMAGRDS